MTRPAQLGSRLDDDLGLVGPSAGFSVELHQCSRLEVCFNEVTGNPAIASALDEAHALGVEVGEVDDIAASDERLLCPSVESR